MSLHDRNAGEPGDAELDQLVLRCLSRIEAEGDGALEAECERHPSFAERLRRRMQLLREAGLVTQAGLAPEEFPERLGDFRLLRRLGGGGMGVVYLAEQTSLCRRIALKLIRPEQLYFPGARARFAREAQAIAKLAHPGIVPVHTVGEAQGIPYLAMELVAGASLAAVLAELRTRAVAHLRGSDLLDALCARSGATADGAERTAMPFSASWPDACAWIAREVAQALEHAHQRGVVHRDVKPSNVMLTTSGRVMLVDFGLASTGGADHVTRTGSQPGSLPYMAPEQIEGRGDDVGPRTDVYGLGVTLFECLTLHRPFDDENSTRLRAAILRAAAPRIASLAPAVPRELEAAVGVAMSPELGARYSSAADFARDLSHVLAREPIEARPSGVLTRARRWAQRNPARALAALLAALIVLGGPLGFGLVQKEAAARERVLSADVASANLELRASNAELERKRVEIEASLARESDERERAQANFEHALDAVDTLLAKVGHETLENVPQMEGVRRELLESALTFYERFLDESGSDPRVRLRNAVTLRMVANIRGELGQRQAAREPAAAAVATLRELESAHSAELDVSEELVMALEEHAEVLMYLQDFDESEDVQLELRERLRAAIANEPPPAAHERQRLALCEQQLAFLLRDTGRVEEAREHAQAAVDELRALSLEKSADDRLRHRLAVALMTQHAAFNENVGARTLEDRLLEALDLMRNVIARNPNPPIYRESLASGLGALGLLLSPAEIEHGYRPRGPSCEQALREAIAINSALIAEFPVRSLYRVNVASESTNLCIHLIRTGRAAEARPFGERAVAEYEALVAREPGVADHHSHLGACLSNVAALDLESGEPERALELIDRSILEHRIAIDAEPLNPAFRKHIRHWHVLRTNTLLKLGRWREANEQMREFEAANTDENARLWSAEKRLECAVMASNDVALDEDQRESEPAALHDETVELLRKLVEDGFSPTALAQDPAFAPLQEHEGFRQIVELPE